MLIMLDYVPSGKWGNFSCLIKSQRIHGSMQTLPLENYGLTFFLVFSDFCNAFTKLSFCSVLEQDILYNDAFLLSASLLPSVKCRLNLKACMEK